MKRIRLGFGVGYIRASETLRDLCSFAAILVAAAIITGCQTTRTDQADANTIIRQPDKGYEVHGEVGAMYGSTVGRH
jgi:uncharacterized SAM-binding protein YcdF (DUF218 family)